MARPRVDPALKRSERICFYVTPVVKQTLESIRKRPARYKKPVRSESDFMLGIIQYYFDMLGQFGNIQLPTKSFMGFNDPVPTHPGPVNHGGENGG